MKFFLNKKVLGILVSLIFLGAIISHMDMDKTIRSFGLMNPLFVLPITPLYLSSFILRAFRWRILLHKHDLKFNSLLSSVFIGFSLNCVLPARAGEIYRAYFFSKKENLRKTKVFTSVILERIFDGFTLFLILAAAIYLICPGKLFSKIAFTSGLVFLTGFAFMLILAKAQQSGSKRKTIKVFLYKALSFMPEKFKKSLEKFTDSGFLILHSFLDGLATMDSWRLLAKIVFYSFLIWFIEGFFMLLVIKSFGIEISFIGAMLVLTVTAFSSLIPAGPAGIGPYQWGYMLALGVFNIEPELAFAISIINQLLAIILVLSAGSFFIWKEHLKFDEIKQNLEKKQQSPDF